MNLVSNMNIDEVKLKDIDDLVEEDELYSNNDIANEGNQHNHVGPDQHEHQQNHSVLIDMTIKMNIMLTMMTKAVLMMMSKGI